MSTARLLELSDRVETWWGVHLYTRVVADRGEPTTDWYYVSIPESFLDEDDDSLLTILLHEWGHRTVFPRTPRDLLFWQGLVEAEGMGSAADLVNILADVTVDRFYLSSASDWADVYRAGTCRHLELMADSLEEALSGSSADSLAAQRLAVMYDLEVAALSDAVGDEHEPLLPVTETLWEILSDERRPLEERIREAASELRPLYPPGSDRYEREFAVPSGIRGGHLRADASSADVAPLLRRWREAGVMLDEADIVRLLGPEQGEAAFEESEIARIYGELSTDRMPVRSGEPGPAARAGSAVWRWGEPPQEIDWISTFSAFGVSVPGVTTVRSLAAPGSFDMAPVAPGELCLIVDDSGSMSGPAMAAARRTAVSLIRTARARRDVVSAVVFGDAVAFRTAASTDYAAIERRLVRCIGLSGGTNLGIALEEAGNSPRREGGLLACIISDGDFADAGTPALSERLVRLTALGNVVIFAIGSSHRRRPSWLPPEVQWRSLGLGERADVPLSVSTTSPARDA